MDDVSTQRSVFKLWVWVLSRAGELFCSPHLFEACLRVDCDVFVLLKRYLREAHGHRRRAFAVWLDHLDHSAAARRAA